MQQLTNFQRIDPAQLLTQVLKTLKRNRQIISELIEKHKDPAVPLSWDTIMQPLDDRDEALWERLFAPAGHLKSVVETDELRLAYNEAQPLITTYETELGQNRQLFDILKRLRQQADGNLNEAQRKQLDNYLLDCHLSGVDLPPQDREEYKQLATQLAQLSTRFSENVLDATQAWQKRVSKKEQLAGVPVEDRKQLRHYAKLEGKRGYLLSLQLPAYFAIIRYADDEALRQEVYTAYSTRASDQHEQFVKYDNGAVMAKILVLRSKLAKLLGYENSASMLMARNMVKAPAEVKEFLLDLAAQAKPRAKQEVEELEDWVKQHKREFHPWDVAYYSEKLHQHKFHFSSEELRDYFVAERVFKAMFVLGERLFNIRFKQLKDFPSWHKDVQLFAITRDGKDIGYLYCDLYARKAKRSGAWMDENCQRRRLADGGLQLPVAYLVCNFRRLIDDKPPLLLHDDVITLFHEFGHCLHHLLTQVEYRGVAGISGVPHDMVELPSQLMENWCWHKDFLMELANHYQTNQPLPAKLLDNLLAAKNFQSGLLTLRQVEFALFDMRLHSEFDEQDYTAELVQRVYDEVRGEMNFLPQAAFNRLPNSFSHIFAGGYAAGYYAYKWAEVMADDIYGAFTRKGIYDNQLATKLRQHIFERGGVGEAMENFVAVLGRKPDMTAFLHQNGLIQ